MKIEKLPSGSYRIRKMYKGKMYTVVFDRKPTQKEAMQAMAAELDKVQESHESMTFKIAAERYIESKRNVLSPSTIRGYLVIQKRLSESFLAKNIHDVTALDVQEEINRVAKDHSPKTVRNHHGFISAVLSTFYPNLKLTTTLPQKKKNEPYIPSDEDIKRILECAEGTRYEIPIKLACYGMRRSEICALRVEDISGDVVRIDTREIVIPMELADKIRKQGYVYQGHPCKITHFLLDTEERLSIPKFSIHKLRHYFASKMSAMNIPEEDIMKMGGWETDHVMKGVYRHAMADKDKNAQREAAQKLGNTLFG